MRTRSIIGLALALSLLLTACSGGEAEDTRGRVSLLARAAELDEEELLLTANGREIPAWRYLYWLDWVCRQLQSRNDRAEVALDWQATLPGGTLADYARDQALADTVLYATVEHLAERYGVDPADAPEVPADLPEAGLAPEQMAELERVGRLYAALYDLASTPGSPLAPSEEALLRFGEEQNWLTVERLLFPFGKDRETARRQAEEAFARINGAEDQGTVFAALAGEDGRVTLRAGEGTLSAELESAALSLEAGQCSGVLETAEGFALLRRLETDAETLREAWFDDLLRREAEGAAVEVTDTYRELDIPAFHRRLLELQEEGV